MRGQLIALLSCCLILGACCSVCTHDETRFERTCLLHPEGPFDLDDVPPGSGLVFGTADFASGGGVLIKIQIEDLSAYSGDEGDITVWSGNGDAPSDDSVIPPPGGTEVYASGGDVPLRHWTTHLDRNYDPDEDTYWLFVRVDHKASDGTRVVRHLWNEWPSGPTSDPDEPHDFNQY